MTGPVVLGAGSPLTVNREEGTREEENKEEGIEGERGESGPLGDRGCCCTSLVCVLCVVWW
jgi:hypothetical protein